MSDTPKPTPSSAPPIVWHELDRKFSELSHDTIVRLGDLARRSPWRRDRRSK